MKKVCVIYAPFDTYSGYGSNSRDIIKVIIELKEHEWDIQLIPDVGWGSTPKGFVEDNKEKWGFLEKYVVEEKPTIQPDIFIMISVPNEMLKYGKFNILFTAGIESTLASPEFIEGCNKADLVITSSNHSKEVFQHSIFDKKLPSGLKEEIKLKKPIKVLFEGVDLKPNPNENFDLSQIKENFNFLFVGSWLEGDYPYDRKGIGLLIYNFLDAFKNYPDPPGLILKTSLSRGSNLDLHNTKKRINLIKDYFCESNPNVSLPSIYIIHGELKDEEIFNLYNNPKVKAMAYPTRGEGFGRPLLEFSMVNKPIIVSNWSGPVDFLKSEYTSLIPGSLVNIHKSAANKMLLKEAKWFDPNRSYLRKSMVKIYKQYKKYIEKAKRQGHYSRENFSTQKRKEKLKNILEEFKL